MKSSKKNLIDIYNDHCTRAIPKTSSSEPSFKPSVLGSKCLRKVYYSYNKAPEDIPFPLDSTRIVELGTAIGEMLFNAFDKQGIVVKYRKPDGEFYKNMDGSGPDYEFRLSSPELGVRLGKIDLVTILNNELWLGEIKSIKSDGFDSLIKPKPDHLIQGILYLYLFNQHLADGKFVHIEELNNFKKAEGIRFLYYCKDNSKLKEYAITQDDDTFRQIVTKIESIKWFTEKDQLPPKTPEYCNTCTYKFRCAKNKKAKE